MRFLGRHFTITAVLLPLLIAMLLIAAGKSEWEPEKAYAASQSMPKVYIYTDNNEAVLSKEDYVECQVTLTVDGQYQLTKEEAEIRVRGNTTATPDKKAYRLRFETKTNILGLNDGAECRNWCLLSDWFDYSFLRNYAALNVGQVLLGENYFVPDCIHVEVYLNSEYRGVYLLTDRVQIQESRVNITEKEEGSNSTKIGYLLSSQGERTDEEDTVVVTPDIKVTDKFGTTRSFNTLYFSLSGSGYSSEQMDFAGAYLSKVYKVVEKALYYNEYYSVGEDNSLSEMVFSEGTSKEEKQKAAIGAVLNIDSFVRSCVMEEFVKDFDIGASYNLYFDASDGGDKRVTLAAPWDYDFSLGNVNTLSTAPWSGWFAGVFDSNNRSNPLLVMLDSAEWFRKMECDIWNEYRCEILSVIEDVLNEGLRFSSTYEKDYKKWGYPQTDRTNLHSYAHHAYFTTHDDATYFLYDWMLHRFTWLDENYNNSCCAFVVEERESEETDKSTVYTLSAQSSVGDILRASSCTETEFVTFEGRNAVKITINGNDPYVVFSASNSVNKYKYAVISYYFTPVETSDIHTGSLRICYRSTDGSVGGWIMNDYIEYTAGSWNKTGVIRMDGFSDQTYWDNIKGTSDRIRLYDESDIITEVRYYFEMPGRKTDGDSIYISSVTFFETYEQALSFSQTAF